MSVVKKLKKCITRLLMFTSRSTRASSQRNSLNAGGADGANAANFIDSTSGIGQPSVVHALVVIFLEFFAWGLLTIPNINVLNRAFPQHAFLMNGLIMGVKGFLSFLSAPLVGTLSDTWGRKIFLLLTVFFTCMPIPFMAIAPSGWYFVVVAISGLFGVTFSVIFAFVADVTDESERSTAYGLVSATFAASLVTSPALGAYMSETYGDISVVALATAVAVLDFLFIFFVVPESLPKELRITPAVTALDAGSNKAVIPAAASGIDWNQVDPFRSLKKVGSDRTIMLTSLTVFLSYLPEAGQYSCIFVYLKLIIGFTAEQVSIFLAVVGLLSVLSQTLILSLLMKKLGSRQTILVGLFFQALQLAWFGIGREHWMMYGAGVLAAVSSITYPAISAHVSNYASHDQQGLAQGVLTGVRGLCNGFGPALYGTIFYMFHVDLSDTANAVVTSNFNHGLFGNKSGQKHSAGLSYHDELHFYGGTPFTRKHRPSLHDGLHATLNLSMPNATTWANVTHNLTNTMISNSAGVHIIGNPVSNVTLMLSNHTDFIPPLPGSLPGPAFVVGAMFVLLAIAAASFMPDMLDSLTHGELYSALSRYSSVREFDFDYDERHSSSGAEMNEIIFYAATGRSMSMAASSRRQPSVRRKKRRQQSSQPRQNHEPRVHLQRDYKGSYSAVEATSSRGNRHPRRTSDDYGSSISSDDGGTLDGVSIDEGEVFFSTGGGGAGSAADEVSLYGYDDTIQSIDMIPHSSSSSAALVAPQSGVAQMAPTAKRWQFPGSVIETARK